MLTRYEHQGLTWVDLESPTLREVQDVASEFGIDVPVAEELLSPSVRPRADFFERYVYLVLHFPALRHSHKNREQEVDFLIGRDFLVTAHYDVVDPIHKFSKVFEVNAALDTQVIAEHGGFLFFSILKKLYKAVEHELEHVRREQNLIEEHIFSGHEVRMVEAISRSARDLLALRQTIEPHRDVLRSLESDGAGFFGPAFVPYLKALSNDYFRVHSHIMRSIESLHELRETNNSLLTTKQNETMRVLTIMALLTFPLSLMVAIFDINTVDNPFSLVPHGFFLIVGLVIAAGALMLAVFKLKKWL